MEGKKVKKCQKMSKSKKKLNRDVVVVEVIRDGQTRIGQVADRYLLLLVV